MLVMDIFSGDSNNNSPLHSILPNIISNSFYDISAFILISMVNGLKCDQAIAKPNRKSLLWNIPAMALFWG